MDLCIVLGLTIEGSTSYVYNICHIVERFILRDLKLNLECNGKMGMCLLNFALFLHSFTGTEAFDTGGPGDGFGYLKEDKGRHE